MPHARVKEKTLPMLLVTRFTGKLRLPLSCQWGRLNEHP